MERLGFSAFVISVFFLSYALLCGFTSSAFAEQPAVGGDFYIGLSASLERFDASYAKTTDTTDILFLRNAKTGFLLRQVFRSLEAIFTTTGTLLRKPDSLTEFLVATEYLSAKDSSGLRQR